MYNRKKLRITIIIFSFLIITIAYIFTGCIAKRRIHQQELLEKVTELGQNDFRFLLWSTENTELYIEWWLNEADGTYYLFLPSAADSELVYLFNIYDSIQIDEKEVTVGEPVSLSLGKHKLVLEGRDEYNIHVMKSKNLASLFIETDAKNLNAIREARENIATGSYILFDEHGNVNCNGEMEELRGRGNISYDAYPKKPFAFKTTEKIAPLGMELSRKWTLIANASDETLMRNELVMEMGRGINMSFVPDMEYIDLYIDGEYQGNYQLAERIEIASGRVDIRDLETEIETANLGIDYTSLEIIEESNERFPSLKWTNIPTKPMDISSGYLLELDMLYRYYGEISGFITSRNQPIVVHEPKYVSNDQLMYLANQYQNFEDALDTENGYNEETSKYFYEYIDMESFAQKYLIEEMCKNLDASLTSFFLYLPDKDGKIYAGPLWDYDRTFGVPFERGGIDLKDPYGFYASEDVYFEQADVNLMYLLCQHPEFQIEYKKMYFDRLRDVMIDITEHSIDSYADHIMDSAMMNAIRWNSLEAGTDIEANRAVFMTKHEDVKSFIEERLLFLDMAWE